MRNLFLALALVLVVGCDAQQDLIISNDYQGSYVRVIDHENRIVVERLDYGQSVAVEVSGIKTYSNTTSSTHEVVLTANGYRKSDNCPLGSTTYRNSFQSGQGITGVSADSWHITGFISSGNIDYDGRCLFR